MAQVLDDDAYVEQLIAQQRRELEVRDHIEDFPMCLDLLLLRLTFFFPNLSCMHQGAWLLPGSTGAICISRRASPTNIHA